MQPIKRTDKLINFILLRFITFKPIHLLYVLEFLKTNHIETNRVKDAKWLISNNCFSVAQFEKILAAFDYDDSKFKLATFGYDYIINKENFLNLMPSFYHKTEKEELKKFYNEKTTKQN